MGPSELKSQRAAALEPGMGHGKRRHVWSQIRILSPPRWRQSTHLTVPLSVLHVELELPDGGRPIEAHLDAEPLPILAKLETCRDQSVLGDELGLAKGGGSGDGYG